MYRVRYRVFYGNVREIGPSINTNLRRQASGLKSDFVSLNSGISGIDVHALYPVPSGSFWDIKNVFNTDD